MKPMSFGEEADTRYAQTKARRSEIAIALLDAALDADDHDLVRDLMHAAHKVLGAVSSDADWSGLKDEDGQPLVKAVKEREEALRLNCSHCQGRKAEDAARSVRGRA